MKQTGIKESLENVTDIEEARNLLMELDDFIFASKKTVRRCHRIARQKFGESVFVL